MRKNMEQIVALCKRRGFIFQSSEIYGGLQGFWDYGPLGVELKRNVREAWWRDMITLHDETHVPPGAAQEFQMVGLETSIIMHPQVWKASGHYDLFHDMKVECSKCKRRFRADHVLTVVVMPRGSVRNRMEVEESSAVPAVNADVDKLTCVSLDLDFGGVTDQTKDAIREFARVNNIAPLKKFSVHGFEREFAPNSLYFLGRHGDKDNIEEHDFECILTPLDETTYNQGLRPCPVCRQPNSLTEPRAFNLMLESHTGAIRDESSRVFLRPETAQGMFVNFKNVLDSSRVKVPFGIAQIGKSFRNEITPRNYTFRSREFEQMEMEFFCHPSESRQWYEYWRNRRMEWYADLGITSDNLKLREHGREELSHYSVGTADVEYAFPFLDEGKYGELEGVAHRGDFDLRSHMEGKLVKDEGGCLVVERDEAGRPKYAGSGADLAYFDAEAFERDKQRLGVKSFKEYLEQRKGEADPGAPYRFVPHVIEPAAGADRATLAFLCEAYAEDEQPDESGKLQKRTLMRFHPRLAPIKAAVFPLIKKDGMPEAATRIFRELKAAGIASFYDQQGAIGRRYRRQDEIGTPYCITVDGDTAGDHCVTLRDRDTLEQQRVPVAGIVEAVRDRLA